MKINSAFSMPLICTKANSINKNNHLNQSVLIKNSFDTVSFSRNHLSKTETKKLERQGKMVLRDASRLYTRGQQLKAQAPSVFAKANDEYQIALEYIKLADLKKPFVKLENGNFLHFLTKSDDYKSFLVIEETDKNNKLIREIYTRNSTPYKMLSFDETEGVFNRYHFDDIDKSIIRVDYDTELCQNGDVNAALADYRNAKMCYSYYNGELHEMLVNVRCDKSKVTADEKFDFVLDKLTTFSVGCKLNEYIEGCNGHYIFEKFDKQYCYYGNKLISFSTDVDEYGMYGETWGERLYFDNDKVVKKELNGQLVSYGDEPCYMEDTLTECDERIRVLGKTNKYVKETDVIYDGIWGVDYHAL